MTNETESVADESAGTGARVTRRRFLQAAGIAAGVVAAGGGAAGAITASGRGGSGAEDAAYVLPEGFSGTIADLRHVVILMQENRSFDHYLGQLPGVRGHNDRQVLRFQDGTTVFEQRDAAGTVVTPFSSTSQAGCDHSFWDANGDRWNTWLPAKGRNAMRYFLPSQMPWFYSVASQYTVGDMNFCSLHGPTFPNRYYLMSGTSGGRTSNSGQNTYAWTWSTIPEMLEDVGVNWRVYSDNSGNGYSGHLDSGNYVGDYGCNVMNCFTQFDPRKAPAGDLAEGTGKIWKANAALYSGVTTPNNDSEENLNAVLRDFIAACQPGAEHPLPEVSWIVMPMMWSEHPSADQVHGERYMNKILQTLMSNEEIWNHTLFIVTYDENDGIFDHVLPPTPEPGTPGEFSGATRYGFGPRVPMLLISPWTRGGYVSSEVTDHTSVGRFLEVWAASLGKPFTNPNISAWRRSIAGDLTSALDFAHPMIGRAAIADPVAGPVPALAAERMKPRPLSYHPTGTFSEDRAAGTVTAHLGLAGGPEGKAVSLHVFADRYRAFANEPHTVTAAAGYDYTWDTGPTDGNYAFSVYGPDGFLRSHAGRLVPPGQADIGIPRLDVDLVPGAAPVVRLTLRNDGLQAVRFTLTANDYLGGTQTYHVAQGAPKTVEWPTKDGYYDVIVTADTGTGWTHRYAGRVAQLAA